MTEEKRAPEQDASEGDRATIERELKRSPGNDNGNGSIKEPGIPTDSQPTGEEAIATPIEPDDQNAQTMPPSL